MPATRTVVRTALAATIDGISGLTGLDYTSDTIHTDSAIITELDVRFDSTFARGADDMTAVVRLLTAGDFESAQERLDDLVSKLKDGIEADESLGGVVHYARVSRIRGDSEGQLPIGEQTYAVIDVEVEIVA